MEVEAIETADEHEQTMATVPSSAVVPSEVLNPRLLGSVVKLFVTKAEPNYCMPWQVKPQRQVLGALYSAARSPGCARGARRVVVRVRMRETYRARVCWKVAGCSHSRVHPRRGHSRSCPESI